MQIRSLSEMEKGWFIGNFDPSAYKTKNFEVSYRIHPKGEKWPHHFHKIGTEINLLISGRMTMQGKELKGGDIFILEPYEIADPEFLEDCQVVCVKVPSIEGDKFNIRY
jgi:quercetin dioxygenase-like cupin family protein